MAMDEVSKDYQALLAEHRSTVERMQRERKRLTEALREALSQPLPTDCEDAIKEAARRALP